MSTRKTPSEHGNGAGDTNIANESPNGNVNGTLLRTVAVDTMRRRTATSVSSVPDRASSSHNAWQRANPWSKFDTDSGNDNDEYVAPIVNSIGKKEDTTTRAARGTIFQHVPSVESIARMTEDNHDNQMPSHSGSASPARSANQPLSIRDWSGVLATLIRQKCTVGLINKWPDIPEYPVMQEPLDNSSGRS